MRKIIFLFTFVLLSLNHYAQDIYLGAKAGVNFANAVTESDLDFEGKTMFHAGLTAELSFSEMLSLQSELLYSGAGSKVDKTDITLHYASLPLMMRVYVVDELLSLDAGGQFSYLFSDKVTFEGVELPDTQFETSDISLLFGATVSTRNKLFFQARYLLGVSEFDTSGKTKNSIFQLSIGYKFL